MGVIKLTLPYGEIPVNGKQVTFKAPCPCTETEAIQIDDVQYTVVDSLCKCVTGIGGRWDTGAVVSVILDVDNKRAYLQNSPGGITAETAELLGVEENPTLDAAFGAVKDMLGVRSSFKAGSYVGTGVFGSENPCILTFDFKPMMVIVYNPADVSHFFGSNPNGAPTSVMIALHGITQASRYSMVGIDAVYNTASYRGTQDHFVWGDNSFSWYYDGQPSIGNAVVEACVQLNAEGVTYNYIAFGV